MEHKYWYQAHHIPESAIYPFLWLGTPRSALVNARNRPPGNLTTRALPGMPQARFLSVRPMYLLTDHPGSSNTCASQFPTLWHSTESKQSQFLHQRAKQSLVDNTGRVCRFLLLFLKQQLTCSSLGSFALTLASNPVYFGAGPPAIPRLGAATATREAVALAGAAAFDIARAANIVRLCVGLRLVVFCPSTVLLVHKAQSACSGGTALANAV